MMTETRRQHVSADEVHQGQSQTQVGTTSPVEFALRSGEALLEASAEPSDYVCSGGQLAERCPAFLPLVPFCVSKLIASPPGPLQGPRAECPSRWEPDTA